MHDADRCVRAMQIANELNEEGGMGWDAWCVVVVVVIDVCGVVSVGEFAGAAMAGA